ncbi:hypothetical protein CFN78_07800 [Amycolatopsis antarctica]|uniref:Uncharacterized protein n=1 Tax=Amycolatopsis antarctica TaxID=1854586 RepID=A0A263D9U6_9PSEU|nr:hypothetical protein CFN78_07800 [Amycolatopsis antarctica]
MPIGRMGKVLAVLPVRVRFRLPEPSWNEHPVHKSPHRTPTTRTRSPRRDGGRRISLTDELSAASRNPHSRWRMAEHEDSQITECDEAARSPSPEMAV